MRKICVLLVLVISCGDGAELSAQHGRCDSLEGRVFMSVEEMECGLTPNGVAKCPWQIQFRSADSDASTLSWRHSDVEETLRVTCDGAMVSAATAQQRELSGWYDDATRQLTWDGVAYRE